MSMVRKTITLPEELVAEVEELADGNVSAFIARTLEREIKLTRMDELIKELEAEHGPISEEALRRVDEQWPE
jgi:metal-responsive CopG/Arc/MetJ family transcriptional regulator